MPRNNPVSKPALGTPEIVDDTPLRPKLEPLVMDERNALAAILANPVFVKAWRNANAMKPSAFVASAVLNSQLGSVAANNRLHEIRGWEMFAAALVRQIEEPRPKAPKIQENYPDEGRLDAHFEAQLPERPKPRIIPGQPNKPKS